MPQHADKRKGQMAQPAKGLGDLKASADQFAKSVLIFKLFNVLLNPSSFVITVKDHIWASFPVADDDAVDELIGLKKLKLGAGFFGAAFNIIISKDVV